MCKLKGHGSRCPVTPQRKEAESYRQKVKYHAHKSGITSREWLKTKMGQEFAKSNDPKILNPNWEDEHANSLNKLKNNEPQVTMKNNWAKRVQKLEIIKATFPERNERRGTNSTRDKHYHTHEDEYQKEITRFNHRSADELTSDEAKALRTYTSSEDYTMINTYLRSVKESPDMDYLTYLNKIHKFKGDPHQDHEHYFNLYKSKEKFILDTVNNLDTALSERRKLDEPEITYRSMVAKQPISEIMNNYVPNSTITFDNYSSTSHALTPTLEFTNLTKSQYDKESNKIVLSANNSSGNDTNNIIFELQTNAGMSVIDYSDYSHEKEVLLPRGINFKVVDSYAPSKDNPYKFSRYSENDEYEINSNTVVVQLVECDKDGNIISFDEIEPIIPDTVESMFDKY